MDAVLYVKEKTRMCFYYKELGCRTESGEICPIRKQLELLCDIWISRNPEKAIDIVEKWSAEHPIKMNRNRFKEVFGVEPRLAGFQENHTRALGLPEEWWDAPYEEPKEE